MSREEPRTRGSRAAKNNAQIALQSIEDDNDEGCQTDRVEKRSLLEEDDSVSGSDLFGFTLSGKKRKQKMCSSDVKRSPAVNTTPSSGKRNKKSQQTSSKKALFQDLTNTPKRTRQIRSQQVKKIIDAEDSSSSSEDDDDHMEELKSDSSDDEITIKHKSKPKSSKFAIEEDAEGYFRSQRSNPTSDHTLARLETPRFAQNELRELLTASHKSHLVEKEEILESTQDCFGQWKLYLNEGYNICVYGVGSKVSPLNLFRETHLDECGCVVINGYFPGITVKQILSSICEALEDRSTFIDSPGDDLSRIESCLNSEDEDVLYVLIHNLDGRGLRSNNAQSVMSRLARCDKLHLVASIDHINAPLLWDCSQLKDFGFIWWELDTYNEYIEETSWEGGLLVQQQSGLALSSLHHVYNSLNPNAQRIFIIIVNYQIEHADDPSYIGYGFMELYKHCKEEYLVHSEQTLRAQLTEFKDHLLVKSKRGYDGAEYLLCSVDINTLKEFVQTEDLF